MPTWTTTSRFLAVCGQSSPRFEESVSSRRRYTPKRSLRWRRRWTDCANTSKCPEDWASVFQIWSPSATREQTSQSTPTTSRRLVVSSARAPDLRLQWSQFPREQVGFRIPDLAAWRKTETRRMQPQACERRHLGRQQKPTQVRLLPRPVPLFPRHEPSFQWQQRSRLPRLC